MTDIENDEIEALDADVIIAKFPNDFDTAPHEAEIASLKAKLAECEKARMLTVEVPDSWLSEEIEE